MLVYTVLIRSQKPPKYDNTLKEFHLSNVIQKVRMLDVTDDGAFTHVFSIHEDDRSSIDNFLTDVNKEKLPPKKKQTARVRGEYFYFLICNCQYLIFFRLNCGWAKI